MIISSVSTYYNTLHIPSGEGAQWKKSEFLLDDKNATYLSSETISTLRIRASEKDLPVSKLLIRLLCPIDQNIWDVCIKKGSH